MHRFAIALALSAASTAAWADTPAATRSRDLCPDRPGLGTPACALDAGRLVIELGLGDWTRDKAGSVRTDAITTGDALVRFGLNDSLEAQIGWTAYGHVRTRDSATGFVDKASGTGDVTMALRQNLKTQTARGSPSPPCPISACRWAAMRSARATGVPAC